MFQAHNENDASLCIDVRSYKESFELGYCAELCLLEDQTSKMHLDVYINFFIDSCLG